MIFAREVSDNLTGLVKKIDTATAKNSDCRMGSFVVFLNDDESIEGKLKELAKKEGIEKTILAVDNPAGPQGYNIPKDADITVVLYNKRKVLANHAFKKGELKEADVEKVVADLKKTLPARFYSTAARCRFYNDRGGELEWLIQSWSNGPSRCRAPRCLRI